MPTKSELDEILEGVDEAEATPTAQEGKNRQPNWDDDPKFREWKSGLQSQISAAERRAIEAEQRAAALEAQTHQDRMANMTEAQAIAYQNGLLQKELQRIQRERDLDAYAIQRQRDLQDIVRKTGVPIEKIENAPNVHEAWQIGYDYKDEQALKGKSVPKSRDEDEEEEATPRRRVNDVVDTGGGKPRSKAAALQAEYDKHRAAYNVRQQLEIMAKADELGVTIREW